MKRFFSLACMAIVAIVASVSFTSCSKSDDGGASSGSALIVGYGFSDAVMDNFDLTFNYTDANGKAASTTIDKADCEKSETTVDGKTYTLYIWTDKKLIENRSLIFTKSLASGECYVSATKKSSSTINDDQSYYVYVSNITTTVSASEIHYDKQQQIKAGAVKGNMLEKSVQSKCQSFKTTYTASSDGTLKITSSSTFGL